MRPVFKLIFTLFMHRIGAFKAPLLRPFHCNNRKQHTKTDSMNKFLNLFVVPLSVSQCAYLLQDHPTA